MKFLLDENFPRSVTAFLEEKGHEVIDLRVIGLLGASDAVIAEKRLKRVLWSSRRTVISSTLFRMSIPPNLASW